MTNNNRFVMCMECKYAVWPEASLGECHHPDGADALTMDARKTSGRCGPNGTLYERKAHEHDG